MIRNYLSVAIRNIKQSPLFAFINIFSLGIGLAACIIIYLFIKDEKSFDAFHTKNELIYRLDEIQSFPGTNTQKVALSMPGMGLNMVAEYPEVENFTLLGSRRAVVRNRRSKNSCRSGCGSR
jgi:putative ABC transport system permease protein